MLTADKVKIKNQIKVSAYSIKYALIREMMNKFSFITNILFMILNNATFIIQWVVIYQIKNDVGGYTFNQILLLWGIAAGTYGFSHFFFKRSFSLSEIITTGKLDSYLVQPKNVLLAAITSDVEVSALGDLIYGYIMLMLSGIKFTKFLLFSLFTISGGIIITDIAVILSSLSFWIGKSDTIADTGNSLMINFATYPDGIFKGVAKGLLFSLIPVGIVNYIPIWVMIKFNLKLMLLVMAVAVMITVLTFVVFYKGLKKYSSSNLMISRI